MAGRRPTNEQIADLLDRIADLLDAQNANVHRVRAYRQGAQSVRDWKDSVAWLARKEGAQAVQGLPNIGKRLAALITEFVKTGRSSLLSRLEGEVCPEDIFAQVPGIGDELAERIATELGIDTLEELEQAAHDGRLEKVEGFGPKRVQSVRLSVAGMLSGAAQRRMERAKGREESTEEEPSVGLLLEVDSEYRTKASEGELRKIAPKRFNPEGEAWLPIMHTESDGWHFTALYSNTARAHELGTTDDWVVIYYEHDHKEDQVTVVTETRGPLKGKRVVRGREDECRDYYEGHETS
ncbi:MAG TPA: DNA-binding protein [Chloroflexi bacterium]|nr:DNA-binding protein [Chloroflexota bacterium]